MADIHVSLNVEDKFSQRLDEFEKRLRQLEGTSGALDRNMDKTAKSIESAGDSASKSGGLFKGLGGAMFIANQAMQAFCKIAESVKGALDDIALKEQAIAMLGPDAGQALAGFAHGASRELGRSRSEIMNAAMRWRRTGIGGADIVGMTALADRFANLNPGKSYEDVAGALNDAVRGKDVGALAELLGGGEGVERALRRAGVERRLRSGDVSGAMEAFQSVADGFGYTQAKADQMGNTISRKVEKITGLVKDRVTDMFGNIVSRAEPYIDRVLDWIQSDEFEKFFDEIESGIVAVVDLAGAAVDGIGSAIDSFTDTFNAVGDDLTGETTSTVEKMVGIFVGGFSTIGAVVVDIFAGVWNSIISGIEYVAKAVKFWKEWLNPDSALNESQKHRERAVGMFNQSKLVGAILDTGFLSAENEMALRNAQADLIRKGLSEYEISKQKSAEYEKNTGFDMGMKIDFIDPVERAASNIESVMQYINGLSNDSKDRGREQKKATKILQQMSPELSKIRGAMTHEQDLRWLKERAEQRAINNVNVRQLTPTINVRIEGGNLTQRDVERGIQKVLEEQINAGTFNAYGAVV